MGPERAAFFLFIISFYWRIKTMADDIKNNIPEEELPEGAIDFTAVTDG